MRRRTQIIGGLVLAGAIAAGVGVAACSNQSQDQGGVAQANPDYVLTYLNVDGFPNPTILCIQGVGFVTISRDYQSLQEVPEWNAFCKTQIPAGGSHVNPGTGTVHPVTDASTAGS
jgi:hypothetical protein